MIILIGMSAAILIIAAFLSGFFFGEHIAKVSAGRAGLPGAGQLKAESDEEKMRQLQAELKAFEDTMNYSIDVAYGSKKEADYE